MSKDISGLVAELAAVNALLSFTPSEEGLGEGGNSQTAGSDLSKGDEGNSGAQGEESPTGSKGKTSQGVGSEAASVTNKVIGVTVMAAMMVLNPKKAALFLKEAAQHLTDTPEQLKDRRSQLEREISDIKNENKSDLGGKDSDSQEEVASYEFSNQQGDLNIDKILGEIKLEKDKGGDMRAVIDGVLSKHGGVANIDQSLVQGIEAFTKEFLNAEDQNPFHDAFREVLQAMEDDSINLSGMAADDGSIQDATSLPGNGPAVENEGGPRR